MLALSLLEQQRLFPGCPFRDVFLIWSIIGSVGREFVMMVVVIGIMVASSISLELVGNSFS
jgi:hypothetical protein